MLTRTPGASVLYVRALRPSLLRAVRTSLGGCHTYPAPTPRTVWCTTGEHISFSLEERDCSC